VSHGAFEVMDDVLYGEDSKIAKYWEDPIFQRVLRVLRSLSRNEHNSFDSLDVVEVYNDTFRGSFSTTKTEMIKVLRNLSRDGLIETMKGHGQWWLLPNREVLKDYINSDVAVRWSKKCNPKSSSTSGGDGRPRTF
jgi:hypothetical protein